MHRRISICVMALAGLLLCGSPLLEAQEPPGLIRVVKVQLHTDRVADWVDGRKVLRDAIEKGDGKPFNVWQVVSGNTAEYWVGTPANSFAEMAEPGVAQKVLGGGDFVRVINRMTPAIASREIIISRFLASHSIIPEDREPAPYIVVTQRLNGPGKRREISRYWLDKILPEMKKAGIEASYLYTTYSGGDPRQTSFVEPLNEWADLDKPNPMFEKLGEKAGDLMFPFWAMFRAEDRVILRHRPDLSYNP